MATEIPARTQEPINGQLSGTWKRAGRVTLGAARRRRKKVRAEDCSEEAAAMTLWRQCLFIGDKEKMAWLCVQASGPTHVFGARFAHVCCKYSQIIPTLKKLSFVLVYMGLTSEILTHELGDSLPLDFKLSGNPIP
jgi:hypothetical protein